MIASIIFTAIHIATIKGGISLAELVNHVEESKYNDSEIYKILKLLMINQARIEVIADHEFHYNSNDKLRNVSINL